jgi:hypothetical protein
MIPKIIKFACKHEYLTFPQSAKKYIPEWYKNAERFVGGKPRMNEDYPLGAKTFKMCSPFLDSLTSGYIVELWQDVFIEQTPHGTTAKWNTKPDVIGGNSKETTVGLPIPAGHDENTRFVWEFPFVFQTPKGYSVLLTHPFNRHDLPFTTMTAVIDSDGGIQSGRIPFFLNKEFNGIIKAGTPIIQILPFKRENWKSEEDKSILHIEKRNQFFTNRVTHGFYKYSMWRKKNYD